MAQDRKWRDQLGLDYLSKARQNQARNAEPEQASLPPYMDAALLAHGHRVLKTLEGAPDGTVHLFDLVDELDLAMDTLGPVVAYMEEQGYVEIVEKDPKGNHTVRITRAGQRIAAEA